MKFTVLTLFPKVIEAFLSEGLVASALKKNLFSCDALNPRDFTTDIHRTADDRAFGGGDGMVMMYEPLARAVDSMKAKNPRTKVVLLTPQGRLWKQSMVREWVTQSEDIILVCGRYAGVDQRFALKYCDEQVSIGDYVLNGGELAACVVMETLVRLMPGVLGNQVSAEKDSFSDGLLEAPVFTRPREVDGMSVPAALLTGNHKEIAAFERAVSLVRTRKLRPDLWQSDLGKDFDEALKTLNSVSEADLRLVGLTREDLLNV